MQEETRKTALRVRAATTFLAALLSFLLCLSPFVSAEEAGDKAASLVRESMSLAKAGNFDKAEEVVREALKADQNSAEAYDQLGKLLLRKGQYEEAANAFHAALKINPRLSSAETGLGMALFRKGDLSGAETALKEALRNNPYPSQAHYTLGLVYEKQNEYDKALAEFKEGIRTFKGEKK